MRPIARPNGYHLDPDDYEQMGNIEASVAPYLRNLSEQREKLLNRAKKENIKEDSEAMLD